MNLTGKGTFLLVALGAMAAYKYNKMTEEERDELKEKGKKIFDDHISPLIKSTLGFSPNPTALRQELIGK